MSAAPAPFTHTQEGPDVVFYESVTLPLLRVPPTWRARDKLWLPPPPTTRAVVQMHGDGWPRYTTLLHCKGRTLFTPGESSSLKHWTGKAFEDKATAALGSDTERLHLKGLSVAKGRESGCYAKRKLKTRCS
ncbi:unnamed protein product [Arctogadus glacialis]